MAAKKGKKSASCLKSKKRVAKKTDFYEDKNLKMEWQRKAEKRKEDKRKDQARLRNKALREMKKAANAYMKNNKKNK